MPRPGGKAKDNIDEGTEEGRLQLYVGWERRAGIGCYQGGW